MARVQFGDTPEEIMDEIAAQQARGPVSDAHVCAMVAAARTAAEYLNEAVAICNQVRVVWFTRDVRYNPAKCANEPVYKIFRRGMGLVATRSSPASLVAYLRKQRPPG